MRTYQQALFFLNSFLNLEQVPKPESRLWNLKRMRELLGIFHHPEKGKFIVLIAGTKGKGSTGYFLSEILRQSGLKVGFYHSPHLEEPRERIWMGGKPVSRSDFAKGLLQMKRRLKIVGGRSHAPLQKRYTYFEILTLLAALLFKEKKVQIAVFEVGMGGRLDATRVLPAQLFILTPIHYDHEAFLGNTLAEIAHEKAAILRPDCQVVVAPQKGEAGQVIRQTAHKKRCKICPPLPLKKDDHVGLLGDFQKGNAAMALRAATLLRDKHRFPLTQEGMRKGLASNRWPGRMELLKGRPSILLDGAHNPYAIATLCRNLKRLFPKQRKILIFGTSRDKKSERMFPQLSKLFEICILTRSRSPRAKELGRLLTEAKGQFRFVLPAPFPEDALALARKLARPQDLIVVTGSFYLIGELRRPCRR